MADGEKMIRELTEIIERFRERWRERDVTFTAHFTPNDAVPKDTIYVMELKPLHLSGSPFEPTVSLNLDKDYSVAVHPDTLLFIRAEFHRMFPTQRLNDNEIAVILVSGSLKKEPKRTGIYGLNTDIS